MNEKLTIGEIIEVLRQRHIYVGIWVGEWDADGFAGPSDRVTVEAWRRCPNVDPDVDEWAREPGFYWRLTVSELDAVLTSLYEFVQRYTSDPCTCLACERVRDRGDEQ